jgi:hypothetical protein
MLALQKTLDSPWEVARVSLRQDLDTIQTVLNRRWGQTFGAANLLPASSISGAAAFSRVSDTNVILTLGGSPTTALLAATSITASWSGVLAYARGGTNIGTAWTQGSIFFAGATTFLQDNAHLFWDAVNNYLGVRTNAPANAIDVIDTIAGPLGIRVKNMSTAGGNTHASLFVENSSSYGQLFKAGTGYVGYKNIAAGDLGFFNITAGHISILNDFGNINFAPNGMSAAMMTITNSGVAIGFTTASAYLHLHAGSTVAGSAPLKINSGALLTTAEAGAVEFLTDDFFATITTAAARKAFVLDDGTRLTSGKYPKASTNGRLIDGPTPLAGIKVYWVSDTSGGVVNRKLTFTDGILTAET